MIKTKMENIPRISTPANKPNYASRKTSKNVYSLSTNRSRPLSASNKHSWFHCSNEMILFTAPTSPGTENSTHLITPTGITRAEALTDEAEKVMKKHSEENSDQPLFLYLGNFICSI